MLAALYAGAIPEEPLFGRYRLFWIGVSLLVLALLFYLDVGLPSLIVAPITCLTIGVMCMGGAFFAWALPRFGLVALIWFLIFLVLTSWVLGTYGLKSLRNMERLWRVRANKAAYNKAAVRRVVSAKKAAAHIQAIVRGHSTRRNVGAARLERPVEKG